jgi:hypothetical protein
MQPSANSNKIHNASSVDDKPSSTFQLVVASVDWTSKAISNLGYTLPYWQHVPSVSTHTSQAVLPNWQHVLNVSKHTRQARLPFGSTCQM